MTTNAKALAQTLDELKAANRIERIKFAQVTAVESMAEALDYDPSNAALWRQYREALKDLVESDEPAGNSVDDDVGKLFE